MPARRARPRKEGEKNMADNDSEKTEYISQKKLEESRKKGELPKSQELGTFVVFAIFLLYFGFTRTMWFEQIGNVMADLLSFDRHMKIDIDTVGMFLQAPTARTILVLSPLFVLILIISPIVSMSQTGFNFAQEKMTPDWNRLNPVSGLQRMFSLRQWIEGAKSSVKISLFVWLAWGALAKALPDIEKAGALEMREKINQMLSVSISIGTRIAVMMAVLAVFDFGYQWWEFHKKLKMTHQEMKDEAKERDGNPLIKQRQRSLQMQRARERMMAEVSRADVVVTNPTHFAVAIRYDREKAPAPYVCAKGTQHMAFRIRDHARANGVPVIENRPLARGLYKSVKLGRIIPAEFYKAVAELLAFVYMLKRHSMTRRSSGRQFHHAVGMRQGLDDESLGISQVKI